MDIYKKAYEIIGDSSPLESDCGLLCNKACCQGTNEQGMYLFPGELRSLNPQIKKFMTIRNTKHKIENEPVLLAICNGNCKRKYRPLSCRIFPLSPYFPKKGSPSIILDPRAHPLCPISRQDDEIELSTKFINRVSHAFDVLLENELVFKYIEFISSLIDDYVKMRNKFFDNR